MDKRYAKRMGKGFLIDTSVASKYLRNDYEAHLLDFLDGIMKPKPCISFVTKIELLAYNPAFNNPEVIAYKQDFVTFVYESFVIGLNDALIDETIRIRKTVKLKLPDAIIAATAIVHDLTLLSDNDSDFVKVIPLGLQYLNPKQPL
jgi:predicted nucleic acid-binding protein